MSARSVAAGFKLKPLVASMMLALGTNSALALPQGGVVAAGTASINTSGSAMTIQQSSASANYRWQSFDIGQSESVRVNQPSATSVAFHYVLGNTNSRIDGTFSSNGQLFLSNPNGIVFGATAQVNAAGLTLEAGAGHLINAGQINVGGGHLIVNAGLINNSGLIEATSATAVGGRIVLSAGSAISNTGSIDASGTSGGSILLNAGSSVLQQGSLLANGSTGAGGSIALNAGYRILQNSSAITRANGSNGGNISYRADTVGADAGLMLSGAIETNGNNGNGGSIVLTGTNVELLATRIAASGSGAGGNISIGGGFQGRDATIANAQNVSINTATRIDASGAQGNGGNVVVWSDQQTMYSGDIKATGGMTATQGGQVEVSGKNLGFNGMVDASTANGLSGSLLLDPANIVIQSSGTNNFPSPLFSLGHSGSLLQLPNGNLVVTNWMDSTAAANAGAAYLFNGQNGQLISILTGSKANDAVGNGAAYTLSNGNYLISSSSWANGAIAGAGALTWGSSTTGVSGAVSVTNSLVGQTTGEVNGFNLGGLIELPTGNYLWSNNFWNDGVTPSVGAVTFIKGNGPTVGTFRANSLIGNGATFDVGNDVRVLPSGNYLVVAKSGVVWGSGTSGVSGIVSSANGLVGSVAADQVGGGGVVVLSNGNYLVSSPQWGGGVGALTWGSGTAGARGVVSSANSIVGQAVGDITYLDGIMCPAGQCLRALPTGNYLLAQGAGVTFIKGNAPTTGMASANSLITGGSITILSNGNYLVSNSQWNNGAGAVTWGNGTTGTVGVVSSANSLVGSTQQVTDFFGNLLIAGDHVGATPIIELTNSNYLISTPTWNTSMGAVTWGNGTTGVSGVVSSANSLVGSTQGWIDPILGRLVGGDQIGNNSPSFFGITALNNGNYVVTSIDWGSGKGAVTWGSGTAGISGIVSSTNSLVGNVAGTLDLNVGHYLGGDSVGLSGTTALPSGNYLVQSPTWNNGAATAAGAVTWGSGTTGVKGFISAANSLVGTSAFDGVGLYPATVLPNGDYVVASPFWNNGTALMAGAVTRGSGTTGIKGVVSATNSLVGTVAGDSVGVGGITLLPNSNYLISSPLWNNGALTQVGAATWKSGTASLTGTISAANSLIGGRAGDRVGFGTNGADGILTLSNGNYLVSSPNWSNGTATRAGALTWGNGNAGATGVVTATNSIVGETTGDVIAAKFATDYTYTSTAFGLTELSTGNYVWTNPNWSNGAAINAGAVTFINGNKPTTGTFRANSLVGSSTGDFVGATRTGYYSGIYLLDNGNYLVRSPSWSNGAATNAGAITWGSGMSGITGVVSSGNSLVGTTANNGIGDPDGRITELPSGNFLITSPYWSNGIAAQNGALTWANGSTGLSGTISASNSLLGIAANPSFTITVLPNGNYLVVSPFWSSPTATWAGAVTWGSGTSGVAGTISDANSLVGSNFNDSIGGGGVVVLSNGNYVVVSNNGSGAVTWGDGSTGISGIVSTANSLTGTARPGQNASLVLMPNGKYFVNSYGGGLWAVTWSGGATGVTGSVTIANSIIGSGIAQSLSNGRIAIGDYSNPWVIYEGVPSIATPLQFSTSTGQTTTIDPAAITNITNTGTAVTLQASNDITVNSAVVTTPNLGVPKGGNLTLQAGRSVLINANIDTAGGNLNLIANDLPTNGVVLADRMAGAATIQQGAGASINTGTGLLNMEMRNGTTSGAVTLGNISAGRLNVLSSGAINQSSGSLLTVNGSSTLNAGTNAITLTNTTNDFKGAVIATSAAQTQLTDVNALTALLNGTGTATLKAGGTLTVLGGTNGGLTTTTPGVIRHVTFSSTNLLGSLNAVRTSMITPGSVLNLIGAVPQLPLNNINQGDVVSSMTVAPNAATFSSNLNVGISTNVATSLIVAGSTTGSTSNCLSTVCIP